MKPNPHQPQPLRFRPDARLLRQVRDGARASAQKLGAPADQCEAVSLVVDELVNNAIEHGACYRQTENELTVRVGFADGRLTLDFFDPEMPEPIVQDLARSLAEAANGMPSLENERGRGLFLISIYMEELRIDVAPAGGLHLHGRLATNG